MISNPFEEIDKQKFIQYTLKEACNFVEFHTPFQLKWYKIGGYIGPTPKRFHPSSGDKMILRKIIEWAIDREIPEKMYCEHNAKRIGREILFNHYYPEYQ